MDVARSDEGFNAWVAQSDSAGASHSVLTLALSFYEGQRFDGLVEDNGDTLLFQYGSYDWGSGPHFEVDLTRQFIERTRDDDDHVFSQLRTTLLYKPTADLIATGSGERWCHGLSELASFATWISEHPVLVVAERGRLLDVRIGWRRV